MTDDDILQKIHGLQFTDRGKAEGLLQTFIANTFELDVKSVELRPQAISLNSFNGFLTLADSRHLFFKTHTEQDNVISEYYNASMLAAAGYNVIQPVYSSTEAGRHLLIYDIIEDPSVFDLARQIEHGDDSELPALTAAQNRADDLLWQHYLITLEQQTAEDAEGAPIHQLFYHRLVGGRLERFYGSLPGQRGDHVTVKLPSGAFAMRKVRTMNWVINGQRYSKTLDNLIAESINLLNPFQPGPSIIGHGDAHNGNVFFSRQSDPPSLLYFDPAFAGRHHPLLDLAKPLFHNAFAMLMYFPHEECERTRITFKPKGDTLYVEHDYDLSQIRHLFLRSKVERVLIPVLEEMRKRGDLRWDWRAYLKAALFCCTFLTLNLTDGERFPPEISLLGLAMSVEMGAESGDTRSLIDQTLDDVARVLAIRRF